MSRYVFIFYIFHLKMFVGEQLREVAHIRILEVGGAKAQDVSYAQVL